MYCHICYDTEAEPDCKVCRNNRQYRYLGYDTHLQCKECGVATRLFSNGNCRSCNVRFGLKECSHCGQVKLKELSFSDGKRCLDCSSSCVCGECKSCLATAGLKRCRLCSCVKSAYSEFHPGRRVCTECYRDRNRKRMLDRRRGT